MSDTSSRGPMLSIGDVCAHVVTLISWIGSGLSLAWIALVFEMPVVVPVLPTLPIPGVTYCIQKPVEPSNEWMLKRKALFMTPGANVVLNETDCNNWAQYLFKPTAPSAQKLAPFPNTLTVERVSQWLLSALVQSVDIERPWAPYIRLDVQHLRVMQSFSLHVGPWQWPLVAQWALKVNPQAKGYGWTLDEAQVGGYVLPQQAYPWLHILSTLLYPRNAELSHWSTVLKQLKEVRLSENSLYLQR